LEELIFLANSIDFCRNIWMAPLCSPPVVYLDPQVATL